MEKTVFLGGGSPQNFAPKITKNMKTPPSYRVWWGIWGVYVFELKFEHSSPFECILLAKMHSNSNENEKLCHFGV